jgi:ribosomal protein S18 acetylase RimI-like enzyme
MPLSLRPMTDAEFTATTSRWCAAYADHLGPARGLATEEAVRVARAEYDEKFSGEGQLLFTAVDGTGAAVGALWLSTNSPDGADGAWVSEVEVERSHRGNGYGREIMTLAEAECRARGVHQLRLNVFGYNVVARRLYESLGYSVLFQKMAKDLD